MIRYLDFDSGYNFNPNQIIIVIPKCINIKIIFLLLNERLSVLFTFIKILRTSIFLKTSVFDFVVKLIKIKIA
jgi:hypothetical protein